MPLPPLVDPNSDPLASAEMHKHNVPVNQGNGVKRNFYAPKK